MAVDRKQVEAVAFDAYMFPNGTHWMMSAEVLAELCRAWLALDAAPEVEVKECCSHAIIGSDWDDDLTGFNYCGQRVRLVATPASGGPKGWVI